MKIKNWLFPLVLFVSTVAVIIAVFFPLFNLVYSEEYIRLVVDQYGWFSPFATLDPAYLATLQPLGPGIPTTIGMFITIPAIFAMSYLVLAFVALLLSAVITLLRIVGIEIKDYDKISKVIFAVLLIGTIGFIVSAILFICLNQSGVEGVENARLGLGGTFALWTIVAGLILGTIASFLSRRDIMEEDAEIAEKRAKALARKQAREEEKAKEEKIISEKKTKKETDEHIKKSKKKKSKLSKK